MDDPQFNDMTLVPAKLRIHKEIRDDIISRFGEECLIPDGADYYIVSVYMPIDDLACRYLMGFGNKCVCLEPEAMRRKIFELSSEIAESYKDMLSLGTYSSD